MSSAAQPTGLPRWAVLFFLLQENSSQSRDIDSNHTDALSALRIPLPATCGAPSES